MKHTLLLAVAALTLTACSDKGGSSAPSCGSKTLFTEWVTPDAMRYHDFTGMKFGSNPYALSANGTTCSMTVILAGSECSGNYSVVNSTHTAGPAFNCSVFNATGSFTKSASGLSICTDGEPNCIDYN